MSAPIAPPLRVIVVGFGPVGSRFVDEVLPAVTSGALELTVIGGESVDSYNRVLVAEHAVGRVTLDTMMLADSAELAARGVKVRTGVFVVAIDREAKSVSLSDSSVLHYDRLVLATGARSNVPTLDGVVRTRRDKNALEKYGASLVMKDHELPTGVTVLRDLQDSDTIARAIRSRQKIVVLGAGVLGLEFALAARVAGAQVCVVHHGSIPMPRNLDRGSGATLASALAEAGVAVIAHSRAEAIIMRSDATRERRFAALATADGKDIDGDLLVLSCGVQPRLDLAVLAGISVATGILVDDKLTSWTDPDIFAIGDCAEIAPRPDAESGPSERSGGPSGLIGPGWRQAEWLASRFVREVAGAAVPPPLPAEKPAVVMLKAESIDVVSAGDVSLEPWDADATAAGVAPRRVAQWVDPEHGSYVKIVTRGGVLEAFVSVGMPRTGAELTLLFQRGSELPADRSILLRLDGPDSHDGAGELSSDATVCSCNGVTAGQIEEACTRGHTTVESIAKDTRAGTGCGGCTGRIAELLRGREGLADPACALG